MMSVNNEIWIISGEASGDLYGGKIATELKRQDPSLKIKGLGGLNMRRAGVEIMVDSTELGVIRVTSSEKNKPIPFCTMIVRSIRILAIKMAIRLYHIPFSPKIYRKDIEARVKEIILVYTRDDDNPLAITDVSTCPTNQINSETTIVTIRGRQYTKAALMEAAPRAMFG